MAHEEWLDLADVYALDALEGEELTQFNVHLESRCTLCQARIHETTDVLALVPRSLEPLTPPTTAKTRVFAEIDKEKPDFHFVHAAEGEWREMAPGIVAKILASV